MGKRLYLSRDKQLAGVCGGIAEYINVDPTIVRLLWVIFTLTGGVGLIVYIIAAIIMSERPKSNSNSIDVEYEEVDTTNSYNDNEGANEPLKDEKSRSDNNNFIIGLGLIIAGGIMFSRNIFGFHWINLKVFWPAVLIAIGLYVLVNGRK
ncbi:PspC domain-containing protein [Alkaliphilus pronyensis]|nr:PspC domain-containing protein [Alkaliphilus pronyensis]